MKLPSFSKFMDFKSREDYLGPAKVEEIDADNLPVKEIFFSWQKEITIEERKVVSQRFSRSLLMIGIIVGFLLLVMQQFFVLLVVGSLVFFVQALRKVSPENVKYEISNHGVMIDDSVYYWSKLRRFFFITSENSEVLVIDTVIGFPGRIYLSINLEDKEKIKATLEKYLHYLDAEPRTFLDDTYDKVVKKFSVDDEEVELKKEPKSASKSDTASE